MVPVQMGTCAKMQKEVIHLKVFYSLDAYMKIISYASKNIG
jgi:hypothetical protein